MLTVPLLVVRAECVEEADGCAARRGHEGGEQGEVCRGGVAAATAAGARVQVAAVGAALLQV